MPSLVTEPGFADAATALAHFERRLGVETDCSDVHESLKSDFDFVLVDVRGPKLYARGHVPRAINIPHRDMTAERMAAFPKDTAFVVYCAGPHCNGANKAAIRLARRPAFLDSFQPMIGRIPHHVGERILDEIEHLTV